MLIFPKKENRSYQKNTSAMSRQLLNLLSKLHIPGMQNRKLDVLLDSCHYPALHNISNTNPPA